MHVGTLPAGRRLHDFPADCDYADMIRQSTRAACIDCGIGAGTVRAENPVSTENGTRFILSIPDFCREEVELPVHGRHMVTNALLAAAAGWVAGLAKEQIASGLTQARLTGGRLHCSRINGILVVDDTYNANPDSMQAALRTLAELSCAGRRFAVLGRMGELGVFPRKGMFWWAARRKNSVLTASSAWERTPPGLRTLFLPIHSLNA